MVLRRNNPDSNKVTTVRAPSAKQRHRLILSAVHMMYRLVNSTYNLRELCLRLTRLLCHFVKARSITILLLDPERKRPMLAASFKNGINIFKDKRELKNLGSLEKKVLRGQAVYTPLCIAIPLVTDEIIGALFLKRGPDDDPFNDFERELVGVFAEQAVTAIKNLQLYEQQQKIILGSMKFIQNLLAKKGHWTMVHSPAYYEVVRALAKKLNVNEEGLKQLQYACILHDAGALDVPYDTLAKTEALTPQEFKLIRTMPSRSAALIRPIAFLRPVLPIVLYLHEKYDGTGYPSGLKKEQIPLGARIMAVVDAFEAMVRGRPYREPLSLEKALQEIRRHSGTQFDPKVVKAFEELAQQKRFRRHLLALKERPQ